MVNFQPINVLTFATCSLTLVLNYGVRTEDTKDDETVTHHSYSQFHHLLYPQLWSEN